DSSRKLRIGATAGARTRPSRATSGSLVDPAPGRHRPFVRRSMDDSPHGGRPGDIAMWRIPLPGDNVLLLTPRWSELQSPWQIVLPALLFLVPVGLMLWLYRYELRLVRRWTAWSLLAIRLLLLAMLWFVVGWQPVLVHEFSEEISGRVLIAVDRSRS